VTIALWDLLTGGDGVRFQQIVDDFNASQDRIQVERTTLEWGVPFYTKVPTSIATGQQPDVVTYHLSRLPSAVAADLLQPISEAELASAGLAKDDFPANLIDKATFDGELYAVPIDIHPLVLY
jgi:multiple sugar transport system substrate-binding protein